MKDIVKQYIKRFGKTELLTLALILFIVVQFLYYYSVSRSIKVLFLASFALTVLLVSYGMLWHYRKLDSDSNTIVSDRIFPVAAVSLGLLCCFFFPAGSIPDEPVHFYDSYTYTKSMSASQYDSVRAEDVPLFERDGMLSRTIQQSSWSYVVDHAFDSADTGSVKIDSLTDIESRYLQPINLIGDIGSELPQQKLPSAVGIGLAFLMNFNHVWLFYAGRITNMLFAMGLIIFAVRLIPVGKNAMMTVALFPMTLHLVASYSYDAPTIGYAFLLTAFVVALYCGKKPISRRQMVETLVLTVIIAPCKVVYSVIGFAALFVPCSRFANAKEARVFKTLILALPLCAIVVCKISNILSLSSVSDVVDKRGEETGIFWSLSDICADPTGSFQMLWHTFECFGAFWLFNIPGDSLGWFQANTSFPDFVPFVYLALFGLSCIQCIDDEGLIPSRLRIIGTLSFACASFGIVLSMWLGWTFVSDSVINGVQGRYFLPLMPLLAIAIRPRSLRCDANLSFCCLSVSLSLLCIGLMYISAVAV